MPALDDLASGQTLRVLLVSAEQGARDEVEDQLSSWVGDFQIYWVSQPELCTARAQDIVPHVILVEDPLPGTDLVRLIGDLTILAPGAAILALVEPQAMAQARQAVLAGARGFLTKPLEEDDLVATLRQTLAPRRGGLVEPGEEPRVARGRILVFCAPKGGLAGRPWQSTRQ